MKSIGDEVVLRAIWPPLPRVGDVIGVVHRRTGKFGPRRYVVVEVKGKKITCIICPATLDVTFKWWWASRVQRQRAKELARRRHLIG